MSSNRAPNERGVGVHFEGDLRQALLDATAAILSEGGPDGLSLRDVARRVGVSHAAPAHHFADRTGLLTAVATEGFKLFSAHMKKGLEAAALSGVNSMTALGHAYLDFAATHPGHFEIMFRPDSIRVDDPAYSAASADAFALLVEHVAAHQTTGWNEGEDSERLAVATWALTHGLAVLRKQGSFGGSRSGESTDALLAIANTLLQVE